MFNFLRKQQDFSATPPAADIHFGNAKKGDVRPAPGSLHPEAAFVPPASRPPSTRGPEDQEVPPATAVLVCHGMGEQVRFETIGQIAASLLSYAKAQGCTPQPSGIELAQQTDSLLARAELHWIKPDGTPHSVHIYEAYWAPVTEGKVTYWDTVAFLFSAAWKGMSSSQLNKVCSFDRYLFNSMRRLPIASTTKAALMKLTAVLLAQVLLIALVTARIVAQLKDISTAHWAIRQMLLILLPGVHNLWPTPDIAHNLWVVVRVLLWYLLVAEILFMRFFLIQYAGDVAAYISPYKSSKFEDIRTRIQTIGLNVAKVIYGFGNITAVPEYEKVVVVGHSLGSVLAYDTLNAIINLDNTSATPGSRHVFARTARLITFGSPLDKTAFLFRNQSNHAKDPLREQMVSAFQPLIRDYALYRKPHLWINLYSPKDVISGSIDYYDDPALPAAHPLHVENLVDPAANILFYAHVQYWTGTLLAQTLYNAV